MHSPDGASLDPGARRSAATTRASSIRICQQRRKVRVRLHINRVKTSSKHSRLSADEVNAAILAAQEGAFAESYHRKVIHLVVFAKSVVSGLAKVFDEITL